MAGGPSKQDTGKTVALLHNATRGACIIYLESNNEGMRYFEKWFYYKTRWGDWHPRGMMLLTA